MALNILKQEEEKEEIKFKKRSFQEFISKKPKQNGLMCPICLDPIVNTALTKCGHAFCLFCINEYFLLLQTCPICHKKVKKFGLGKCKVMDTLIEQFIQKQARNVKEDYQKRKLEVKDWNIKRK